MILRRLATDWFTHAPLIRLRDLPIITPKDGIGRAHLPAFRLYRTDPIMTPLRPFFL